MKHIYSLFIPIFNVDLLSVVSWLSVMSAFCSLEYSSLVLTPRISEQYWRPSEWVLSSIGLVLPRIGLDGFFCRLPTFIREDSASAALRFSCLSIFRRTQTSSSLCFRRSVIFSCSWLKATTVCCDSEQWSIESSLLGHFPFWAFRTSA